MRRWNWSAGIFFMLPGSNQGRCCEFSMGAVESRVEPTWNKGFETTTRNAWLSNGFETDMEQGL